MSQDTTFDCVMKEICKELCSYEGLILTGGHAVQYAYGAPERLPLDKEVYRLDLNVGFDVCLNIGIGDVIEYISLRCNIESRRISVLNDYECYSMLLGSRNLILSFNKSKRNVIRGKDVCRIGDFRTYTPQRLIDALLLDYATEKGEQLTALCNLMYMLTNYMDNLTKKDKLHVRQILGDMGYTYAVSQLSREDFSFKCIVDDVWSDLGLLY